MSLFKIEFFQSYKKTARFLLFCPVAYSYKYTKNQNIEKRGSVLLNWIADKDKRKNWLNFVSNTPKCRNLLEKVHKPARRQAVLNSLFISNITDVISTGDIAKDILSEGVEITGVKISPCYKILNVFWQVPPSCNNSEDIASLLNTAAPKIRAELISRNVLGKVPIIYFLRDCTNARIAEFEKAMKDIDLGPDPSIVPDDSFLDDLYAFKLPKVNVKENLNPAVKQIENMSPPVPQKPVNMKSDTLGLNHEEIMQKVKGLKQMAKQPKENSHVISPEINQGDLFSKIPGICLEADSNRDMRLKQFLIERKIKMEKRKEISNDCQSHEDYTFDGEPEFNSYDDGDDYIEEEIVKEQKMTNFHSELK